MIIFVIMIVLPLLQSRHYKYCHDLTLWLPPSQLSTDFRYSMMNNNTVVLREGETKWYPEGIEALGVEIKDEAPDVIGVEPQVVTGREGREGLKNEDTSGGVCARPPQLRGTLRIPLTPGRSSCWRWMRKGML